MPQFIDSLDDEPMIRRQQDFRGGANEFEDPTNLPDLGVAKLENLMVEDNGLARTRPGADALGGSALVAARIQGLTYFDTPSLEYIFASVSASLRKWDGATWTNIAAYPLGGNSILEMAQGANTLYVSDGSGQWYSYNGAAWSAALGNTAADPPNGASIMCWHTNRMFAAGTIGGLYDQIHASDIGAAGAGDWDSATQAFRVGHGEGEAVTALCSAKGWWLAVGKEGSIYLVNANPTQTVAQWTIGRLAGSVGCVGKRAMVSFGDFLVVLGRDGLRRINATAAEDTPWEISAPFSEPMQPYIDRINWSVANKSVLHKYRHYLFCALPLDSATEPSHVLVWNSRLGTWIGVWTGWTPTAMCTSRFAGVERFIVGDSAGQVNQWKDYTSADLDSTYQDNSTEIPTKLRSKSWNFDQPLNWKDAYFGEVIFTESQGNVDIVIFLDGIEQRSTTFSLFQVTNQLPVNLPFDLAALNPDPVTMSLDGLPEAREMALEVRTTSKRIQIKSLALAAFLNTMKNE